MWEGLKNTIGKTWNNPYASGFRNYAQAGGMLAGGFEPVKGLPNGVRWHGYNALLDASPTTVMPDIARRMFPKGVGRRMLGSAAGGAFSFYNVYSAGQEGGWTGAKDAAVWEVATASAVARFAYGALGTSGPSANIGFMSRIAQTGVKTAGARIAFGGGAGIIGGMARFAGAGIGASIGQAALGTPGAFIGGFIGAAPLRFAATNPLIAGGMAAVGVTAAASAAVVKGSTAILRQGYQHRQRQRGIDTSGSMAAFMTQNAMTMRSRAVQAMHKSHLNARSALGQEAGFMHMPSKNYHSRYR